MPFLPSRESIRLATIDNAIFRPSSRIVAIFFGGTSGIGQAMAEQLARQTNGRAHIILLGRNEDAVTKIIAGLPKTDSSVPEHESSKYEFIKMDATSMAQVRDVAMRLNGELNKINFIVASTGFFTWTGREETNEGIDRKMACNFYARFRFIHDLAPLVQRTAEKGEVVGVMSVLAAGRGIPIDVDDLGMVKNFAFSKTMEESATYNDAVFAEFATLYPKVRFMHISPGIVTTPMVTTLPGAGFLLPLFRFAWMTPSEAAQVMWWRMWTSDTPWSLGAHQINHRGEVVYNPHVTEENRQIIWKHALEMTGSA